MMKSGCKNEVMKSPPTLTGWAGRRTVRMGAAGYLGGRGGDMAGAAPSATRAAAASHGTSDAFVIQMHFMSCLKGVFEMLMAFHQQWWMDILPIMDKLASATYPLHTYYLQFYLLLRNLWVGILWPPSYLVATFCFLWYKDQFLRSIWLKLPKLKTVIINVHSLLFRQLHVRWKARILNSSLFWMTSPFGRMELTQLPYTPSILKHIDMHRFQLSQAGVSTSDSLSDFIADCYFWLGSVEFFWKVLKYKNYGDSQRRAFWGSI